MPILAAAHDLLLARLRMAWSLGFHIVFAVIGIGMPALLCVLFGVFKDRQAFERVDRE